MSTITNPDNYGSGDSDISKRKNEHLDICSGSYHIESKKKYLFPEIDFLHNAFPELDSSKVSTACSFLGRPVSLPVFISCMTGGSMQGFGVNLELAKAAEEHKIAVGMGSFRVLLKHPEYFDSFNLRKYAPSVPVIGNIGAVQLPASDKKQILAIASDLGIDALAVHVNPGQELFQPEGDTDFRNIKEHTAKLISESEIPVIIKETGCGLSSSLIDFFLDAGAAYIDIAGAGGTNWISVEKERQSGPIRAAAEEFSEWGIPTAVCLMNNRGKNLIASGGVHTGLDAVKAIALGAEMAGMARPFIKALANDGRPGLAAFIEQLKIVFRAAMTLTGCLDIKSLQSTALVYSHKIKEIAKQYRQAESEA